MIQATSIKDGMKVLCKDGNVVGTVDHMEKDGKTVKLTRDAAGAHHWLPLEAIAAIDAKGAHLKTSADDAKKAWKASAPQPAVNY